MNGGTQGLLIGLTGSVCLRLAITNEHLRYVNPWMRWPLLATAIVLLALGLRLLWTQAGAAAGKGPASAWMMALPILAVFVISPPALGAYAAERSGVAVATERSYRTIDGTGVVPMSVEEFQGRAQWDDTLLGYEVELTGFVTHGKNGAWYVTGLAMSCCAADVIAFRVQVDTDGLPEVNTWVKPDGTEIPREELPVIKASNVAPTEAPDNPYQ